MQINFLLRDGMELSVDNCDNREKLSAFAVWLAILAPIFMPSSPFTSYCYKKSIENFNGIVTIAVKKRFPRNGKVFVVFRISGQNVLFLVSSWDANQELSNIKIGNSLNFTGSHLCETEVIVENIDVS